MYDWLTDALDNSGTIVTANRRLARVLADEFSTQQLAAGKTAWRSPSILTWQDWLDVLLENAGGQADFPTRLNLQQSQLLWERCLRKEIDDSSAGLSSLVRLSRDTWQKLADWQVTINEVARTTANDDQRMFASVAGRYLAILEHENWIDDAGTAALVLRQIAEGRVKFAGRHTFVGFERTRPVVAALQVAMASQGVESHYPPQPDLESRGSVQAFENPAAEMRAAGRWARQQLEFDPVQRIAIVTTGLEQDSESIARLVREGMTPGWQHGHASLFSGLNVSYGKRLSEFPAISSALLLLRWLVQDLPSTDISQLLRGAQLGNQDLGGRSRIELRLRQLPDRRWSPSMITSEFRGRNEEDVEDDASDWLKRLAAFSKRRRELPKQATPAEWVGLVDEALSEFRWPGKSALNSVDFQLVNRWRELLNEFARLALISARMSPRVALARIESMASETVFQPESKGAVVQLMGPLEASGAGFDRLWLAGVTTTNWPPAGSPSRLLSRRLQEKYDMPDCTPGNTHGYAQQVLLGLIASSEVVVCSYALTDDDAEQTVSELIAPLQLSHQEVSKDPGWYAGTLLSHVELKAEVDAVPAVVGEELIGGGAGTIQRQMNEPVSAFIQGRMSARPLYPQAIGIPPPMRGNLIHDALYNLYIDLPDSEAIAGWQGQELRDRIDAAASAAFLRHERNADAVLRQLLVLERARIAELLQQFVAIDGKRGRFKVASVEGQFEFVAGNIRLPLRFDRIDMDDDDGISILDYKTGAKKRLLNRAGEVQEVQLFVYAAATDAPVSALALVNVDSREIAFDGAGRGFTDTDAWPELLQHIKQQITAACDDMSRGDVRINIEQGVQAARPLNVLTRYTELLRDRG